PGRYRRASAATRLSQDQAGAWRQGTAPPRNPPAPWPRCYPRQPPSSLPATPMHELPDALRSSHVSPRLHRRMQATWVPSVQDQQKLPHQVDVVVAVLIVRRTAAFGVVRRTSLIIDLLPPGRPTGPRDAGQGRGVRGFTAD